MVFALYKNLERVNYSFIREEILNDVCLSLGSQTYKYARHFQSLGAAVRILECYLSSGWG